MTQQRQQIMPPQDGLMGAPPIRATTEDGRTLISLDGVTWRIDRNAPRVADQQPGDIADIRGFQPR